MSRLADTDLSLELDKKEYKRRLKAAQKRVSQLRLTLGGQLGDGDPGPPVLILLEGWDASGKGGAIKRLTAGLDARHVRVRQFEAPTHAEKRHHFLWRFWPDVPGWGGMAIFDRTWYGRVLVERVEGFASHDEWARAYDEINEFEASLVSEGMIMVKLWLHLSPEEQLRRFERRRDNPLKSWKLTDEDWRNRERRPDYEAAVEEMLERTDRPRAPWTVIAGEDKRWARVAVIETVIERIEQGMVEWRVDVPEPLGD